MTIGPMGWLGNPDDELRMFEKAAADNPVAYRQRAAKDLPEPMAAKWREHQASKGYGDDSCDLTVIDELVLGRRFAFEDQFIGSCVVSNTFRQWARRAMYEIALRGDPEEYLGREEFGPKSIAFYAPFSYGCMRRRGGLRGGDGGFCAPMSETLMKDGVLPCSTPKLLEILKSLGSDSEKDFPEPRSNKTYRKFGDWKYLDDLLPYTDYRLLESVRLTSVESHLDNSRQGKPAFQCSSIAVKKVGTHKDGFAIHARDPRNSWAHNMGWAGHFTASDGERYYRLSNESWDDNLIYNIPENELAEWYRRRNVSTMTIGEIDLPDSAPQI